MMMRGVVAAVGSIGLAVAATASQAEKAPTGNAERGKQIYVKYGCYQCHGYEAQGASTGSRLGPNPWAFAAFARYVRRPAGEMPPYTSKVMSDAELADIYAFVASRPRPPARPALLRQP